MSNLLNIQPTGLVIYLVWALFIPLVIRIFISAIETRRLLLQGCFWKIFRGVGNRQTNSTSKDVPADYWLSFGLGVLEMLAYPAIIKADQPTIIGAWLAFKTVHRWSYAPGYSRGQYNRYLVANAIILLSSYFAARWWF